MEALQTEQIATEPVRQPTVESSKSYLARIKSRLSQLPTTPSFISIPSSSSTTESTEELSTIAPTIITTVASTDPSTASTSVLSLAEVFVFQNLYVSPSMPIEETIETIWTRQIRSRLSAILLHEIPTGTCVQEFMGVGRKAHSLKPTLVVSCGNRVTKNRVEKVFKSQGWLQELLKANGIMFIALVAKTSRSAGPAIDPTNAIELSKTCSVELPLGPVTTACGASLLINASHAGPEQHCTLGGLIMVNGEVCGLTARHPFDHHLKSEPVHHILDSANHNLGLLEDSEDGDTSDDPFIFNADNETPLESLSRISTISSQSSGQLSPSFVGKLSSEWEDSYNSLRPSLGWSSPFDVIVPLDTTSNAVPSSDPLEDKDWVLLKELPQSISSLPNKISHVDSRHDVSVEEISSGLAYGEVTITVAGIGAQLGRLQPLAATMNVDGHILNVQLITMERILPLGSSGAWVIFDRKLCGFIVAIHHDIPWAYMTPIEPILNDIKQKLGTHDVRLPTQNDFESLANLPDINDIDVEVSRMVRPSILASLLRQQDKHYLSSPNDQSQTLADIQQAVQNVQPSNLRMSNREDMSTAIRHRPANPLFTSQDSAASTCVSIFTGPNDSTAKAPGRSIFDRWSRVDAWGSRMPRISDNGEGRACPNWLLRYSPRKDDSIPRHVDEDASNYHWERNNSEKLQFNKFYPTSSLLRALIRLLARWLVTVALCILYLLLVVSLLRKNDGLSAISRRSFNAVTVGISIALSLNLSSEFKAMALDLRWRILKSESLPLSVVDHILGLDDWYHLFKVALAAVRRSRPILALALLFWFCVTLFAYLGIATISFTHDFVPGSISGVLVAGNIIIPDLSHFYPPLSLEDQTPTFQDEEYAAHLYGEYAWGVNSTGVLPKAGEKWYPVLWADTQSCRIDLIFTDLSSDNFSDASVFIYTDRMINLTWTCGSYKVLSGGNGTTQNIEVDGLGNILVPETPPDSIAYFITNASTTEQCNNDTRCSVIEAFETSSTDPWYYSCALSLGDTFHDPKNVSYISDQMAQIADTSIVGPGRPDSNQRLRQIYSQPNPYGVPHGGNYTDMGLTMATFALGSIAGASIYNPYTTYEGMVVSNGIHLQIVHPYFYLIICLICGCHLLLRVSAACIMKGIQVGPRDDVSMGLFLKPIFGIVSGRFDERDEEAFEAVKRRTWVRYEKYRGTDRWGLFPEDLDSRGWETY